jgi:hypothetical protein
MLSFATQAAHACSVTDDYVRPTNFELVQITDAIVVATAMKAIKSEPSNSVEFRVDKTLKGPTPKTFIDTFASLGKPWPSDPNDISTSHPEGHAGPCNRTTFGKGKQYVMFLNKGDKGEFYPGGPAFSRVNEDYFGEDSLWVRTIRTYLEIQSKHGPMEQLAALEALLQEKLKGPKTPTSNAEASDILDHLRSRSPWKPTAYLIQTYETLERGEQPKYGVRSRTADRENSWAQDLTDLLTGEAPPPDRMSLEEEKYFVLRSLVLGDHPTAAPLFERLIGVPRPSTGHLGLAIRFFAKNDQHRRAYTLIESQAVGMLAAISRREGLRLVHDIYDAQRGEDYGERKERWRSDPYVAGAWPELALHLYWFAYHVFGESYSGSDQDAIREILITDFRARPLVTLARRHDGKVEKWAAAELLDEAGRKAWEAKEERDEDDDPALLPMQVMVRASGDNRDAVLNKVACQSETRRHLLIATLGQWGGSLDVKWLATIAAMPKLSEDDRMLVGQALAHFYVRETAHKGPGLFSSISGYFEYELLEKVIQGKEITYLDEKVKPLRCDK